ncbi:MAG: BppU family phage baseplate upper protein [Enterococcus sp.]|uniref:BppU family phage baseplate upper protein n=1 Tax=Enterococcus sp. TaxID=35783 RepID=UPI002FCA9D42
MFKTRKDIIVIQAEETEPNRTGVVFWSHDKGTAKMIFELQKNHVDQSLATGTKVPILLEFDSATAENGRGKHTYFATIDDAVNGIVSIILEDNILGYQGRVDGSIYIELPDSRSLDTAGRFTFHIKRSPIDEDVPELEDYYWQGFGEIMEQYHESIAEIKLEAKTLLDSLTADVNTAQNKVTALEQSITTANTNLNTRIDEINKKIDDNDVFTKAESSANVIYQAIGKEKIQFTLTLDFKNKIRGSIIENLNTMKSGGGSSLYAPSAPYTEIPQSSYQSVSILDNSLDTRSSSSNLSMAHVLSQFNVLGAVKRLLGEEFFISQGAISLSQQLEIVRDILTEINPIYWGYGSSPAGNSLYYKIWVNSGSWSGDVSSSSSNVAKLEYKSSGNSDQNYISNDGFLYAMAHSGASNGTTAALVKTDYTCLNLTIELSMNQFIKSLIAQNHVTNLATTEEAKAGTNTTKTMTPATTAQSIDNRAVTLASNQTVGGIKNFKDGLQVAGKNLVRTNGLESAYANKDNTPEAFSDGALNLYRKGDTVFLTGSIKLSAEKNNQGIWFNLPVWARPMNMVRLFFRSTNGNMVLLTYDPNTYDALVCADNVAKDQWLIGSGTWLAKDSY